MISEEMVQHNAKMLADYEPVGIAFDVYFQLKEHEWPKYSLYLARCHRGTDWIYDLEPINGIEAPVLGHYTVHAAQQEFRLGEGDAREYARRSCTYDTMIYKRKAK